jgi:DNA-binding transcriptional ArsR family regulator
MPDNESTPVDQPANHWAAPGVRLRDARSLRALAHPLRVELLTALRVHGPLTATQASAIVDDSPSNCSFHLRTLASFGMIEEIPGEDARQRLWQVVRGGVAFEPDDNAESRMAAKAAAQVFHDHTFHALARWMDRAPDAPAAWQEAWFDSTASLSLTADELSQIDVKIGEILQPFIERRRNQPAGPGEVPVAITAFGYPQIMPSEVAAPKSTAADVQDSTN